MIRWILPTAATLAASQLFAAGSDTALPDGIRHVRTVGGIEEYEVISNGLQVLLMPDEQLPVATVMVTYRIGSRDEKAGTTGATHILEHMMFAGTERFNEEQGNSYDKLMERIGARTNATTWYDRTNYFAVLPAAEVPLAIELEADRMRNLRIRPEDLAREMTVVRNEYERGENTPFRRLLKEIHATAFMAHPYGHPTIGWLSDIESTSAEKLHAFYDRFYWPENATVSVIGGFDPRAALEAIATHYGAIPRPPEPIPQETLSEPEQSGPRRVVVERAGEVGIVTLAYKVPAGTHEDTAALAVLEQVLGADGSGRLYRKLEDTGKAAGSFAYAPRLRDPGLFLLAAYLTDGTPHTEGETLLIEAVADLVAEGVEADELARAKAVIRSQTLYGRDGPYAIASQLNESIAMGDWTAYINLPEAIEAVTAEDVRRVARDYLVPRHATTGWFVPENGEAAAAPTETAALHGLQRYREAAADDDLPAGGVHFADSIVEQQVAGIRVLLVPLPIEQVVSFTGSFAAGDSMNPADNPVVAGLTAAMLDKGTASMDRFEIAERLDSLGASINFNAGGHTLDFSGRFLGPDAGDVLALLGDQLRNPSFDPEVLETVKVRAVTGLRNELESTDQRADLRVSQLLFPEDHPNHGLPVEDRIAAVEALEADALRAFHAENYGPESMLLVFAGDVDPEAIFAAVENAFAGWSGGRPYPAAEIPPLPPAAATDTIEMADKSSISVRIARSTGIRRIDPDYLPFTVGNYILGGSFNSRLMSTVRRDMGLTYDIRSGHHGDLMTPGYFTLSASFGPALLDEGLAAAREVLGGWLGDGVSAQEVADAVQTLTGRYLVALSTTGSVAGQLHSFVLRGREADYIDRYTEDLGAVDADTVNAAIRRHLDADTLVTVMAGTLPQAGAED